MINASHVGLTHTVHMCSCANWLPHLKNQHILQPIRNEAC
jgi:hypothetical protein